MEHINLAPTNDAPIAAFELHLLVPFGIRKPGAPPEFDAGRIADFRDALKETGGWKVAEKPPETDAFRTANYLHPFVNRFWHNTDVVNRWQRHDVKKLQARIRKTRWEEGDTVAHNSLDDTVTYDIMHCTLIRVEPDVGLLHLALKYPIDASRDAPLTWERMLYQVNALRRLYPPYMGATDHAHFPFEVKLLGKSDAVLSHSIHDGPRDAVDMRYATGGATQSDGLPQHAIAPHWAALLSPLQTLSVAAAGVDSPRDTKFAWHYRALGDERAVVLTRISVARTTDLRQIERGNWARLCFADKPGTDKLPYSQESLADFEAQHCCDRWWYTHCESTDTPSRILNSGFAFHWVGSAEDNSFFNEPMAGAPRIFETCYVPMAIIAVTQKTALLIASDRLAQHGVASSPSRTPPISLAEQRQFVETFYAHFVRFTQGLWQDEVTPQIQGMELFDQWRKHLRLQPLYNEVRQELQDMKAWVDQRSAQLEAIQAVDRATESSRLNKRVAWFTKIALGIGVFSLLFSVTSLWVSVFALGKDTSTWLPTESFSPQLTALVVCLLVITGFAAAWVIAQWQDRHTNFD